jgi:hypothetical protein
MQRSEYTLVFTGSFTLCVWSLHASSFTYEISCQLQGIFLLYETSFCSAKAFSSTELGALLSENYTLYVQLNRNCDLSRCYQNQWQIEATCIFPTDTVPLAAFEIAVSKLEWVSYGGSIVVFFLRKNVFSIFRGVRPTWLKIQIRALYRGNFLPSLECSQRSEEEHYVAPLCNGGIALYEWGQEYGFGILDYLLDRYHLCLPGHNEDSKKRKRNWDILIFKKLITVPESIFPSLCNFM